MVGIKRLYFIMKSKFDDLIVEWDDNKNLSNKKKHGIDFDLAVKVFNDTNRIEAYDEAHSEDEDRFITLGLVENVILVIYTMRDDSIRIISARVATKDEVKLYYGNNKNYS